MRSLRVISTFLVLLLPPACLTLWDEEEGEEEEDDQPPEPPTITTHEFESRNSTINGHVSIRPRYEGSVRNTVELHRSAPDDGGPEFYQIRNLDGDSGEVIDDESTDHKGRPRWGRRHDPLQR